MDADKTTDETGQDDSSTRSEHGSGGGHGPPETGERGDPDRESSDSSEPVKEPGDIEPTDDPEMGKETRGG